MAMLDTPDLCARLDRLKTLCDRLEEAQTEPKKYRSLVNQIRDEAEALHVSVCTHLPNESQPLGITGKSGAAD